MRRGLRSGAVLVQKATESKRGSNTVPVVAVPVGFRGFELGRWDKRLGELQQGVVLLK